MTTDAPIVRTGDTGEPTNNEGNFAKRKLNDAVLTTPLIREPETVSHEDGSTMFTEFDAAGKPNLIRGYDVYEDGEQVLGSETHLLDGERHDLDANTPALRSWKDGELRMEMRCRHGEMQDGASGEPAFRAFKGGREELHIHYAGGKVQDPAPKVPAHVATLANGMTRSTFYTQGVVTEQQDRFPTTLGDIGAITLTRTAE